MTVRPTNQQNLDQQHPTSQPTDGHKGNKTVNINNEYASKQDKPMSLRRDGWSERGWNCRMKLVFP